MIYENISLNCGGGKWMDGLLNAVFFSDHVKKQRQSYMCDI